MSQLTAHAHGDANGDTVIQNTHGDALELMDVTPTQLSQHSADFHFFG